MKKIERVGELPSFLREFFKKKGLKVRVILFGDEETARVRVNYSSLKRGASRFNECTRTLHGRKLKAVPALPLVR